MGEGGGLAPTIRRFGLMVRGGGGGFGRDIRIRFGRARPDLAKPITNLTFNGFMDACMYAWIYARMDARINACINAYMDALIYAWMH